jgi:beta-N-acetylhexosaminidase
LSPKVINQVLRKHIGFDGLIMTDDIDMQALSGATAEKAKQALSAGCDVVLQCSGNIDDLRSLEIALYPLANKALERAQFAASKAAASPVDIDETALLEELSELLLKGST